MRREKLSLFKRRGRMIELSDEEHQNILSEREKMWRKRVQKIWDLEDV